MIVHQTYLARSPPSIQSTVAGGQYLPMVLIFDLQRLFSHVHSANKCTYIYVCLHKIFTNEMKCLHSPSTMAVLLARLARPSSMCSFRPADPRHQSTTPVLHRSAYVRNTRHNNIQPSRKSAKGVGRRRAFCRLNETEPHRSSFCAAPELPTPRQPSAFLTPHTKHSIGNLPS